MLPQICLYLPPFLMSTSLPVKFIANYLGILLEMWKANYEDGGGLLRAPLLHLARNPARMGTVMANLHRQIDWIQSHPEDMPLHVSLRELPRDLTEEGRAALNVGSTIAWAAITMVRINGEKGVNTSIQFSMLPDCRHSHLVSLLAQLRASPSTTFHQDGLKLIKS